MIASTATWILILLAIEAIMPNTFLLESVLPSSRNRD